MSFDPFQTLSFSVANVIYSVILNKRYDHGDEELLKMINFTFDKLSTVAIQRVFDALTFLRFVPPFKRVFQKIL